MTETQDQLRARLKQGADELGVSLDASQTVLLIDFLALLERWNRRVNLTAIRDPADMVAGHLLDSLAILPHLQGARVADVGAGGGLPGIPLAIANQSLGVLLIDSVAKKTRFLTEAIGRLGLENAAVWRGRAEDYRPSAAFDTVTARAVAALPDLVRMAGHLVAPGGALLAMKGRRPDDEIAALPDAWTAEIVRLDVPGLDKERHLVRLTLG